MSTLRMKNLSLMVKYVLTTPWCPANKFPWYNVIILSMHASGTARTAVSFSGLTLNNKESNRIYFSRKHASTLLIATLEEGSLFYDKHKYISLKYALCKYPACISFISTSKWVPFNTFLWMTSNILSISVCFGKYLWIKLVFIYEVCQFFWFLEAMICPDLWNAFSTWCPPEMESCLQNQNSD